MFDQEIYDKILLVTATKDELIAWKKDGIEVDKVQSFAKYYSLHTILKALRLRRENTIDDDYMSLWSYIYKKMIGADNSSKDESLEPMERIARAEILSILDNMCFFSESDLLDNDIDGASDVHRFIAIDKVYKDPKAFDAYWCYKDPDSVEKCLFVNPEEYQYFVLPLSESDVEGTGIPVLQPEDYKAKIQEFDESGYTALVIA